MQYNDVPCSRTSTTPPGRRTRFTSLGDNQDIAAKEENYLTSKRTPHWNQHVQNVSINTV